MNPVRDRISTFESSIIKLQSDMKSLTVLSIIDGNVAKRFLSRTG